MKKLFESFRIRNTDIANRIVIPPMVVFTTDEYANEARLNHYAALADGGSGLIIVEATLVQDGGQLCPGQLGIWDDRHIEGLAKIADIIHARGAKAIIQIHHAGVVGCFAHDCPSPYALNENVTGSELSAEAIERLTQDFIAAGIRAHKAGYDGVELHGCHNYLICQFMNRRVNTRSDIYGEHPEKLPIDILNGIRAAVDEDFIIGIRMGAFEPTLADGIAHAKMFDAAGFDFLDVSYGFSREHEPEMPENFPYKDVIYAAGEIKKQVSAPVFAVNSIRTGEQAQGVLTLTDVDAVDVARALLVDYEWVNKVRDGIEPDMCLGCPRCTWGRDGVKCAGRILAARKKANA